MAHDTLDGGYDETQIGRFSIYRSRSDGWCVSACDPDFLSTGHLTRRAAEIAAHDRLRDEAHEANVAEGTRGRCEVCGGMWGDGSSHAGC